MVPALLIFGQPFGINALVGLIALAGILMRNTLILQSQFSARYRARLDVLALARGFVEADGAMRSSGS